MGREEILAQIRTINLQLEVGSKFSEMGVSGYLPQELVPPVSITSPPTLLDKNRARKNELTAMVIVLSSNSLSDGMVLSEQMMKNDSDIEPVEVLKLAGLLLTNFDRCDELKLLLEPVKNFAIRDQVLFAAINYQHKMVSGIYF